MKICEKCNKKLTNKEYYIVADKDYMPTGSWQLCLKCFNDMSDFIHRTIKHNKKIT